MDLQPVIYLTNIVIGVILATLATHYWREQRSSRALKCWATAAWVMTIADVFFAARPFLPLAVGQLAPTLSVTVGLVVLLMGAQLTAGLVPRWRLAAALVGLHAAGLVGFIFLPGAADYRTVFNGLIWGGLSITSALCLRRGATYFWQSFFAPASAFWAHGVFLGLRVVCASWFAANGWRPSLNVLQIVGDLEVSFFMVALFVGLLIAHLNLRHAELMQSRAEIETLSGLLPICAWCKKVRNDDGYWQQVEDYFSLHSRLKFTHGVCLDCLDKIRSEEAAPAPRS
jgi:hypothetical protein